jgi:hypothetical protein
MKGIAMLRLSLVIAVTAGAIGLTSTADAVPCCPDHQFVDPCVRCNFNGMSLNGLKSQGASLTGRHQCLKGVALIESGAPLVEALILPTGETVDLRQHWSASSSTSRGAHRILLVH